MEKFDPTNINFRIGNLKARQIVVTENLIIYKDVIPFDCIVIKDVEKQEIEKGKVYDNPEY